MVIHWRSTHRDTSSPFLAGLAPQRTTFFVVFHRRSTHRHASSPYLAGLAPQRFTSFVVIHWRSTHRHASSLRDPWLRALAGRGPGLNHACQVKVTVGPFVLQREYAL
jgi:phosphoribulokinase